MRGEHCAHAILKCSAQLHAWHHDHPFASPHDTFHRGVERGIFPLDWAGDGAMTGEFGEAVRDGLAEG